MTADVKVVAPAATDRIAVLFGAPCTALLAFGFWLILVNYPRCKPRSGYLPALLE
jgi:hypothetical protein